MPCAAARIVAGTTGLRLWPDLAFAHPVPGARQCAEQRRPITVLFTVELRLLPLFLHTAWLVVAQTGQTAQTVELQRELAVRVLENLVDDSALLRPAARIAG